MLPEMLRGAAPASFASYTMHTRLPQVGLQVLEDNRASLPPEAAARLQALIDEMPHTPLRPLQDDPAPDLDDWRRWLAPYAGQDYLSAPWLLAEFYFYRRILEATGYFQPGPGCQVDPYAAHKRRAMQDSRAVLEELAERVDVLRAECKQNPEMRRPALQELFWLSLWGNQSDLSMWAGGRPAGGQEGQPEQGGEGWRLSHLLTDARSAAAACLLDSAAPGRVAIILDNAPLELAYDLALADILLATGMASTVELHCKAYPTYVSDATIPDVHALLDFIQAHASPRLAGLAARLDGWLTAGRLALCSDPYWNAPFSFSETPNTLDWLLTGFSQLPLRLLISKGDANYRRFLGDRAWPYETPLAQILPHLPAPLLLLRVFKSEVAAGLPSGLAAELAGLDSGWQVSGSWGVIQLAQS
jgi:hypothetical protein